VNSVVSLTASLLWFLSCSILRSRANQLQCDYLLMLTTSEILTNTLVKVNVFLRPYLASASLRRMTHYTRTWMNIDDSLIHLPIECKGKSLQKEQKLRKFSGFVLCSTETSDWRCVWRLTLIWHQDMWLHSATSIFFNYYCQC